MALFNSTVRPSQKASDIGGQRGRLLQSVFPGLPIPSAANSPATPANTREFAMRAPTENHQSAATRAAQAVQLHLASNPIKPVTAPVKSTRENSPLAQSAGTINTNYVNSAAAQGFSNVAPPDIFRGAVAGRARESRISSNFRTNLTANFSPGQGPNRSRESFYNNVFTPTPNQVTANLFAPPPSAPGQQVGVPINTFPPRNQFLNFLFPR